MSKLIFSNGPNHSFITILAPVENAPPRAIELSVSVGTEDAPLRSYGAKTIQIKENHNLCVTNSDALVGELEALEGTIKFHNNYAATQGEATNITIGNNSQVILTGTNLCMGLVTMGISSELNFTHNDCNYQFHTSEEFGLPDIITISNMDKLISTCEFIHNKLVTKTNFALDEICHLRDYQEFDSQVVSQFMTQNNLVSASFIDRFIAENYFEFTAVAHKITDSDLEVYGPYNILGEICSWLDLSDVNLSGEDHS